MLHTPVRYGSSLGKSWRTEQIDQLSSGKRDEDGRSGDGQSRARAQKEE
jgi:hypothetical protein